MSTQAPARPMPLRAWTIGGGGVDHLSQQCPYLRKVVAYRHSRLELGPRNPLCRWCLRHPGLWDE